MLFLYLSIKLQFILFLARLGFFNNIFAKSSTDILNLIKLYFKCRQDKEVKSERKNDKLLKVLAEESKPISLEDLSKEFSVSTRTIRNELNEINTLLENDKLPPSKNIRGQGVVLILSADERKRVDKIIASQSADYYNRDERYLDLIFSIGFSQKKILLYEKEEQFAISKSTMDEDMRRIRQLLDKYEIQIVSDPKLGMIFTGQEHNIRTFLYDAVNQSLGLVVAGKNESVTNRRLEIFYQNVVKEEKVDKDALEKQLSQVVEKLSSVTDDEALAKLYEEKGLIEADLDLIDEAIQSLEKSLDLKVSIGDGYKRLLNLYNKKRAQAAKSGDDDAINYYINKFDEMKAVAKKGTLSK